MVRHVCRLHDKCELDHCICGHHTDEYDCSYECWVDSIDMDEQAREHEWVREAELAAGWDPSP